MIKYPLHLEERFARLLQERAAQLQNAKLAVTTNSGKLAQVGGRAGTAVHEARSVLMRVVRSTR